ncbi:hypothetical protein H1R17_06155 [Flavobacterium sp. xlx-214]|uniref:hypothetical protein n=1 Tax=unclassified Flavobacterium TaxID=196869 RepID=UPI0013D63429|nr:MULTISPECIES: hypothetical protein [unclassified Flavobacterium]MBA5792966.1 hypothetical protein [Flavobacterium sp. xlx-221]QMI84701.1 hypothetical protein H1R17_06155 [Flavobacterium sp. xlx-214]
MKKIAFIFFILEFLLINSIHSQAGALGLAPTNDSFKNESGLTATLVNITTREKILTTGSEYVNASFSEATVDNGSKLFDLRYNNYTGFFEYKKSSNETISISKEQNKEISFKDGRNYFLKNYKINKSKKEEYLLLLGIRDSKVKIYKLESIEFIPYKEALNNYQEQKLPEYKLKKPLFFIEHENNVVPIEKSKDLEKAFPSKSKEIRQFLKQNKIDFASDEFLIVQRFLDSIL